MANLFAHRRISRSTAVVLVLLAAAALQGWMLLEKRAAASRRAGVGDVLPAVQVEQQRVPVRLGFRDLPACTFVVFLSPDCPSCQRLAPRWSRELGAGFARPVVAVSYSSWDDAQRFAAEHRFTFPVFATGERRIGEVARRLGVPSVPRVAVLGEGGRIAALADSRYDLKRLRAASRC